MRTFSLALQQLSVLPSCTFSSPARVRTLTLFFKAIICYKRTEGLLNIRLTVYFYWFCVVLQWTSRSFRGWWCSWLHIAAAAAALYPPVIWADWLLGLPAVLSSLVRNTFVIPYRHSVIPYKVEPRRLPWHVPLLESAKCCIGCGLHPLGKNCILRGNE